MYFKFKCKKCGKDTRAEDIDLYPEDDNPDQYICYVAATEKLCGSCAYNLVDMSIIKYISNILEHFSKEEDREIIINLIEKLNDKNSYETIRLRELIDEHFKGYDGLRAWGLW